MPALTVHPQQTRQVRDQAVGGVQSTFQLRLEDEHVHRKSSRSCASRRGASDVGGAPGYLRTCRVQLHVRQLFHLNQLAETLLLPSVRPHCVSHCSPEQIRAGARLDPLRFHGLRSAVLRAAAELATL